MTLEDHVDPLQTAIDFYLSVLPPDISDACLYEAIGHVDHLKIAKDTFYLTQVKIAKDTFYLTQVKIKYITLMHDEWENQRYIPE